MASSHNEEDDAVAPLMVDTEAPHVTTPTGSYQLIAPSLYENLEDQKHEKIARAFAYRFQTGNGKFGYCNSILHLLYYLERVYDQSGIKTIGNVIAKNQPQGRGRGDLELHRRLYLLFDAMSSGKRGDDSSEIRGQEETVSENQGLDLEALMYRAQRNAHGNKSFWNYQAPTLEINQWYKPDEYLSQLLYLLSTEELEKISPSFPGVDFLTFGTIPEHILKSLQQHSLDSADNFRPLQLKLKGTLDFYWKEAPWREHASSLLVKLFAVQQVGLFRCVPCRGIYYAWAARAWIPLDFTGADTQEVVSKSFVPAIERYQQRTFDRMRPSFYSMERNRIDHERCLYCRSNGSRIQGSLRYLKNTAIFQNIARFVWFNIADRGQDSSSSSRPKVVVSIPDRTNLLGMPDASCTELKLVAAIVQHPSTGWCVTLIRLPDMDDSDTEAASSKKWLLLDDLEERHHKVSNATAKDCMARYAKMVLYEKVDWQQKQKQDSRTSGGMTSSRKTQEGAHVQTSHVEMGSTSGNGSTNGFGVNPGVKSK